MARKTILIADFFGSIKARGIPAYVRDLEALAGDRFDVLALRSPRFVRRFPGWAQNMLMVLHEQLYVPLVALVLRPAVILYPYNSSSILCALSRRCVCIVHDLIPYARRQRRLSPAYLYLLITTSWHAVLGRRVAGVSPFTVRTLRAVRRFHKCDVYYLPNCFASVAGQYRSSTDTGASPRYRLTLVSGHSDNKDFLGALQLFLHFRATHDQHLGLDVVGFADKAHLARAIIDSATGKSLHGHDVTVHELLPQAELDALLRKNAAVWAHSLAEGFGRAIVEGRMAGRPVVMSRLPVFAPFADSCTFAYRNGNGSDFCKALRLALRATSHCTRYEVVADLRAQALRCLLILAGFEADAAL